MRISHRAQQVIAITLGIVLMGVVVTALIREYSPTDNNTATNTPESSETDTNSKPQENTNDSKESPQEEQKTTPQPEDQKTTVFTFKAQPGASYTALAREAVRKYALENSITLNDAQVEKTAARLAYDAGSPLLDIGQVVIIKGEDVSVLVGAKAPTAPPSDTTAKPAPDNNQNQPTQKSYTFTAKPGDAYCLFARSAISDYAKSNNIKLTGAQRIAAETFIMSDAGFPRLAIGQTVTFSTETIKYAVDKALALTPAQLALWQPYANLAGI